MKTANFNLIEKVLSKYVKNDFLAGANLIIIKDDKEIFYHEEGYSDIESKQPINRNTIFKLYSMTKPVTAVAAMILLERGEIDLYDPISKYLNAFKNQYTIENNSVVPVNREIMIRDLLSMTSGLLYGGENRTGKETYSLFEEMDKSLLTDNSLTTLEFVNKLAKIPLAFHPGDSWDYGTSADVLGALIEVVSKKTFGEFLKTELFEPLEMIDTDFWVPENKQSRLAKTYEDNNGNLRAYSGNHLGIIGSMDRKPTFESGGAGLVSTIDDYSKFTRMLMNYGILNGAKILNKKTVEFLTNSKLENVQQKYFSNWLTLSGHTYGNLMRILIEPSKSAVIGSIGEYGWDGWLGSYFCNCPNDNLTFLLMMQKTNSGTNELTRKLKNIILSSI